MVLEKVVKLSIFQRAFLMTGSVIGTLYDPTRGDLLASLTETAYPLRALRKVRKDMMQSSDGRFILDSKPRVTDDMLLKWSEMKHGKNTETFAGAYIKYMKSNGFQPSGRSPVRFLRKPGEICPKFGLSTKSNIDEQEFTDLVYILQRYRETHDFLHALTGLSASEYDEGLLKYFEWTQMGLPTNLLSIAGAGLRIGIMNFRSLPSQYSEKEIKSSTKDEIRQSYFRGLMWMNQVAKDFKDAKRMETASNYLYLNRMWENDIVSGITLKDIRSECNISRHF